MNRYVQVIAVIVLYLQIVRNNNISNLFIEQMDQILVIVEIVMIQVIIELLYYKIKIYYVSIKLVVSLIVVII